MSFQKPKIDRTIYLFSSKAESVDTTSGRAFKYRWSINDITLNDYGRLQMIGVYYKDVEITATPVITRILNLASKTAIDTQNTFGTILNVSPWNYLDGFKVQPPILVSPQTINAIELTFNDDIATTNNGIKYLISETPDVYLNFCVVLKLTEDDLDIIEYGNSSKMNMSQRQFPSYNL